MRTTALLLLFLSLAFAQVGTEGGNISGVDASQETVSSWSGVFGQVGSGPFTPVTVTANPGNVTYITINTGASACAQGVLWLALLFSNSSAPITSLERGNLSALDSCIFVQGQNATETFVFSTTFDTGNYGAITGVPTTYTNSPTPGTFRLGYLQDQADNLVFITPVVSDQEGFNGSLFDFQLMLPTRNGTAVDYYVTVDLLCNTTNATNATPAHPQSGGGGGTHTPYYNQTNGTTIPPEGGGEPEGGANESCDIILYCGDWEPCQGGFRKQSCVDLDCHTNIEVFRVEKCEVAPGNVTTILPEGKIPRYFLVEEPIWYRLIEGLAPCSLFLLILLAFYFLWRKLRGGRRFRGNEGA